MVTADEVLVADRPAVLAGFESRILARSTDDFDAWMRARKSGVSATFIRDVMKEVEAGRSPERAVEVVEKKRASFSGNRYTDRGNEREPIILSWVERRFGLHPSDAVVHHPDFPRHLATPDGVGVGYGDRLILAEVKTSKNDLTPGIIDSAGHLVGGVGVGPESAKFRAAGYYDQMQWQMWVAGSDETIFVWEQHDDNWPNPMPLHMEPLWAIIPRDDARIEQLVELANWYLGNREGIDEAREERVDDYAELAAEYAEADRKVRYWKAKLDAAKDAITERIGDVDEFAVETPAAKVLLVQEKPSVKFDEKAWEKRAPKAHAAYLAARERYTKEVQGRRYVRITPTMTKEQN